MDQPVEVNPADLGDSVVLTNPQGELETVSKAEADRAISEGGYSEADPAAIHHIDNQAKYGSVGQQAIGFAEQALSAATLHGSDVLATRLGITTPEAQEGRKDTLGAPLGIIAQGTGLLAGSAVMPGEGAMGLLGKAGDVLKDVVGPGEAAGTTAKIGAAAVKAAGENAAYQTSDEMAKLLQGEDVSFGTAVANIGLAAAIGAPIGGALGSVSPIWEATNGSRLGQSLKSLSDKFGGIEGVSEGATKEMADRAGVTLSPEAKSVIAKDPTLNDLAQPLLDSQTGSGKDFQAAIQRTRSNLGGAVLESIGKSRGDVEALSEFSENKAGSDIQSKLGEKIKEIYEPIKKTYDEIADKYKSAEFNQADRGSLQESFAQKALDEQWSLRPSSPEAGFIQRGLKDIGVIDNLDKLRAFGSSLSKEAASMNRFDIARGVGELFDTMEDKFVKLRLSNDAPELLGKHEAVTGQYREMKGVINELNARLHAGASKGVGTFLHKLNDMIPEQVLNRLAQTKDASFVEFMNQHFPDVQKSVNDYQLNKLLKASQTKMGSSEVIDPSKFFKQVQKLSPELRNSLISSEGQGRINAISELWDGLHKLPENFSKTAGVFAKSMDKMAAAMGAVISLATGHGALSGALEGQAAQVLGRTIPDAVRLGMIKFLGSQKEISAPGFKAAVDFIAHTIKGENLLARATKNVFKAGQEVLPSSAMSSERDRERLDKVLKSYQENPDAMLNIGGHLGHYMSGHSVVQGKTAMNAVQILNNMRPKTVQNSPLDKPIEPSKSEKAEFDRALDVAEKPLIVLEHVKDGTLMPKDVQVLSQIHPELYHRMIDKLTAEMTDHLSRDGNIPYKTKMGLSLLAGHPLDSTMTPEGLQNTQGSFMMAPTPMQQQQMPKATPGGMDKMAMAEATPGQARERSRLK